VTSEPGEAGKKMMGPVGVGDNLPDSWGDTQTPESDNKSKRGGEDEVTDPCTCTMVMVVTPRTTVNLASLAKEKAVEK